MTVADETGPRPRSSARRFLLRAWHILVTIWFWYYIVTFTRSVFGGGVATSKVLAGLQDFFQRNGQIEILIMYWDLYLPQALVVFSLFVAGVFGVYFLLLRRAVVVFPVAVVAILGIPMMLDARFGASWSFENPQALLLALTALLGFFVPLAVFIATGQLRWRRKRSISTETFE
ncbi:MAG: hypothetical protein AAGE18_04915 [Pseudomonadota bacterium]